MTKLRRLRDLAEETGIPQRTFVDAARRGGFIALTKLSNREYLYDVEAFNYWRQHIAEVSPAAETFRSAGDATPGSRRKEASSELRTILERSRRSRCES